DKPAERPTTNKAEFVKAAERPTTDKVETAKKPVVRYAEMYRRTSKRSNVRGNQRNWNNLKSQQLGPDFAMKKKACYNCGDFCHLVNDCRRRAVINRRNMVKDVQASARWVWKYVKPNSASIILKRYDYVDVRGRSRSVMAWVPKKD
nr:ubiquitin hydrolase [Tanacetum cinerariifolium]